MKFAKIRDVKSPSRANPTDAGIDFFVPEYSEDFLKDLLEKNHSSYTIMSEKGILLFPNQRVLIPSGIHVEVPEGHALIAFNKSGISSQKGLDLLASVVDCGYQGEVHISLNNNSDKEVLISYGSKIIQFVLLPVNFSMPIEEKFDNLYASKSNRGSGGFGSTS